MIELDHSDVAFICRECEGRVLWKAHDGTAPPHKPGRILRHSHGQVCLRNAGREIWIPYGKLRPQIVDRAAVEVFQASKPKPTKEPVMPPEHAPRPIPKATPTPVQAMQSGSLTIAASRIETACKEIESRRADVIRAEADLRAAEDLVSGARNALATAEKTAQGLAEEFNRMVAQITRT